MKEKCCVQPQNSLEAPQSNPYDRFLKVGGVVVVVLVIGLGGWASFASIAGAVIAQGVVGVDGKPKTVQHLDGGIVDELLVRDGDRVKAGDALIRLDDTLLRSNYLIIENRLYEAKARRARLMAERDDAETLTRPDGFQDALDNPEIHKIFDGQQKLFMARRATRSGQIEQLRQRVVQLGNQIEGLEAQKDSKQTQLALIREELGGIKDLHEKGHAPKTRVLELERASVSLEGEIAELQAEVARTLNAIGEAELQILQINHDWREAVLAELRETASQIKDLQEQYITAKAQLGRIEIKASVSGLVHNMTMHTVGGVISAAEPVMHIVPVNERLVIEAKVEPQHIDQVYPGQEALLRLSAFNQRTTPELNGAVIKVSAERLQDPATGFSYYAAKIEIPENELAQLNGLTLVPGMPVEAFIQTGERTALSYLLKPLTDQIRRAFREE